MTNCSRPVGRHARGALESCLMLPTQYASVPQLAAPWARDRSWQQDLNNVHANASTPSPRGEAFTDLYAASSERGPPQQWRTKVLPIGARRLDGRQPLPVRGSGRSHATLTLGSSSLGLSSFALGYSLPISISQRLQIRNESRIFLASRLPARRGAKSRDDTVPALASMK